MELEPRRFEADRERDLNLVSERRISLEIQIKMLVLLNRLVENVVYQIVFSI